MVDVSPLVAARARESLGRARAPLHVSELARMMKEPTAVVRRALNLLVERGEAERTWRTSGSGREYVFALTGREAPQIKLRMLEFVPLDCSKPAFRHLRTPQRQFIHLGLPESGKFVREAA